jgi:hypothetical protein
MIVIADKTKASEYVKSCATPAWDSIFRFCGTFSIAIPGMTLRGDPVDSDGPSTSDTEEEDGEEEQPEETPVRSRAETSKAGQERRPIRPTSGKRTRPRSSPEPIAGESHRMPA